MKVISIGTDTKLFEDSSSVLERQRDYANSPNVEEYNIFVYTSKSYPEKHEGKLHIYSVNKIFFLVQGLWKIGKILKNKKDFVITTQDPFETGLLGVFVKMIHGLPLQVQIHTDFLSPYFRNSLFNKLRVFISRFVIPRADGIRVVSSVIKDSLVEKYPGIESKIDILPIWVDSGITYVDRKDDTNLKVLVASRFEKEKRIDVALKVFELVSNKIKNVELLIAGEGSMKDELVSVSKKMGLERVKFLGWRDDVLNLFMGSNVYLMTSDFEGYGMTLLQAAASGCPIVTTSVGVAKTDLFKDGINSYVCEVGDVNCLANRLTDLLTDENKRKTFSQNMKESVRNIAISREEYVKRYISLLENLTIKKS